MIRSDTFPYPPSSTSAAGPSVSGAVLLVQICFFLAAAALAIAPRNFFWRETDLIYPCCLLLLLHACWAVWSWRRLSRTIIDPYALFLLSALLFQAGQACLEVFGMNKQGLLGGEFTSTTLARTLLYMLAGLSGLHCGALLCRYRVAEQPAPPEPSAEQKLAVQIVAFCLLAIAVVPVVLQLQEAVTLVLSGGYMALYQRDIRTAGLFSARNILAEFATPGVLLLLTVSKERRAMTLFAAGVMVAHSVILLFCGYRGASVMPLVAMAWLWDHRVKRIPRFLLAAVSAVLLVAVFPLVRETRMESGWERASASYLADAYAMIENPLVTAIGEMGKSMAPLAHTIELVPSQRPYDMGMGYAYGLLTVLPSLFWDVHPVVSHGVPAVWLIETVDPLWAREGGGIGFSFIAEAFLNFGAVGVPFVLFLIGYAIVRFSIWGQGNNVVRAAVVAAFLPFLLFFPRAEFSDLPRALVWYALGPYFAFLFIERHLRRRSG